MKLLLFVVGNLLLTLVPTARAQKGILDHVENTRMDLFDDTGERDARGCSLSVSRYSYERIPRGSGGGSFIGGCGGFPFFHSAYGSPVKEVKAWKEGSMIKAIYFTTFSGRSFNIGNKPARAADASITFRVGERLSGSMILTGNGIGTRLGSIEFHTDQGRTFKVGDQKTNYIFDSKGSFLMGFWGKAGSDVDSLGFYMMKEIDQFSIENVNYDLGSYDPNVQPDRSIRQTVSNDNTEVGSFEAKLRRIQADTTEWSVITSLGFTVGGSVTAGVPGVAKVSGSWELSVGVSTSHTSTKFTSTEVTETVRVATPVCSSTEIQIIYFSGVANIDFSAQERIRFTDGTSLWLARQGVYKGVLNSKTDSKIVSTPYKPGEAACAGHLMPHQ